MTPAAAPPTDIAALFDADEYLYFMAQTLADEQTAAQCSFIERSLALQPASRVLDLGCGHGRHSNELARRGHRPLGLDIVPGFIEQARAEAARDGLASEFQLADLRRFEVTPGFDGAACLFDAFGYDDDLQHGRIIDNALAALRPGGRLLLDVRTREYMLRAPAVNIVERDGGDMMIDRFHFDIESGRLTDRRTCLRGGRMRETVFSVRLYAYTELRALLMAHGFRVLQAFGGFDGAPLSVARPRTLVVAEKPESPWA
ncbi:class I SAM-dependent methyltransferase [Aquincola sp. S2]|uniref:Class I SAM-dependent methyltransferase n=1 Tax=Pseudaquabacterium terrae TaxID=2732868 RepID=A0ABX2E976_9BURK|nr:class I SAM-dependent methyltransferase [Aquabacterium terrae]NRF65525.1 class I SAM-dependent methyltransferase [Aquabacterium terrae]